jgi:hypothetical protein
MNRESTPPSKISKLINSSSVIWALVIGVTVLHYLTVWRCSVNVPHWDEWENLGGVERFPQHISLTWLLTQHNEHRILFTRLQTWLLLHLNGWNVATQIRMNFALFLGMVGCLTWMVRRAAPSAPGWFLALCFWSQVTDLASENHLWGFQSQFHVSLLGLMISVMLIFSRNLGWWRLGGGILMLLFSLFSFSAALAGSAVIVGAFVGYRLLVWSDDRTRSLARELCMVSITVLVWLLAVKFYLRDHARSGPAMVLPNELIFWDYYINLLSLGFGFTRVAAIQSIVCAALVCGTAGVFTLCVLRKRTRVELSDGFVQLLVLLLTTLAALASIALGRAGYGVGMAKSSRYAEIAALVVPCTAALWVGTSRYFKRAGLLISAVIVVIAAFGLRNNFRFMSDYPVIKRERQAGLRCVGETLLGGDVHGNCPGLYPAPIGDRIRFAESLGVSFIERAKRRAGARDRQEPVADH